MLQVEFLQFLEPVYRLWDIAIEAIPSKINFAKFSRLIMRATSSNSYKWLLRKERYSSEVPLNISSRSPPLRLFWSPWALPTWSKYQILEGCWHWNGWNRAQAWETMESCCRYELVYSQWSWCCWCWRQPDCLPCGRWNRPRRLPRDREMHFEASKILVTILFGLQMIPSHLQQSILPFHEQRGHYRVIAPLGIGYGSPSPPPCMSWWDWQRRSAAQEKDQYLDMCLLWKLKCMQLNQLQI